VEPNSTINADPLKSYMEKLEKQIFGDSPFRQPKNHISVDAPQKPQDKYCFFNPHNYRLYLAFNRASFKAPKPGSYPWLYKLVNGKEALISNYKGCNLRVKKSQIEVTNLIDDRWYRIDILREDLIEPQFRKIVEEKDAQALSVLKDFIAEFGGESDYKILRHVSENKIMHEDAIDKLPIEMTFRNDAVKKVYMEKNVEFTSPILASNYLRNRSLEAVSPIIGEALIGILNSFKTLQDEALNPLTAQIKLHLEVQQQTLTTLKEMSTTMRAMRKEISQKHRKEAQIARSDRIKSIKGAFGW
jgi:hypothetical protein